MNIRTGYFLRCVSAELRCQDVREFRETKGLAAQRLICASTPVGIAFENYRPVRSEGHVPANKDKVGTRVVRSFDVAQRGIPIGQYAGIIRTKLTVLIDRTVLRRRSVLVGHSPRRSA